MKRRPKDEGAPPTEEEILAAAGEVNDLEDALFILPSGRIAGGRFRDHESLYMDLFGYHLLSAFMADTGAIRVGAYGSFTMGRAPTRAQRDRMRFGPPEPREWILERRVSPSPRHPEGWVDEEARSPVAFEQAFSRLFPEGLENPPTVPDPPLTRLLQGFPITAFDARELVALRRDAIFRHAGGWPPGKRLAAEAEREMRRRGIPRKKW